MLVMQALTRFLSIDDIASGFAGSACKKVFFEEPLIHHPI